jgi:DNA invertase Pin-like site-specific DNA recombinase
MAELINKKGFSPMKIQKVICNRSIYGLIFDGRAVPTTDASIKSVVKYHDFIRFVPKNKENIFLKCLPLYEQGISLNEIARQTGFAKSTVRDALTSTGLPLRKNKSAKKLETKRQIIVKGGAVPYGYAYLEGKLLVDPNEYKIVLDIYRQWQKAQSYRAIARYLNGKSITTRAGKEWTNEIIKRIIDRHECDLKKTNKRKTK